MRGMKRTQDMSQEGQVNPAPAPGCVCVRGSVCDTRAAGLGAGGGLWDGAPPPPQHRGAQSWVQGSAVPGQLTLPWCGISAFISLPSCPCSSADRPPSSKVPQQPPVPPQRPMAVLPPPPVGRSHTVGLLAFFPGAVFSLILPLLDRSLYISLPNAD